MGIFTFLALVHLALVTYFLEAQWPFLTDVTV